MKTLLRTTLAAAAVLAPLAAAPLALEAQIPRTGAEAAGFDRTTSHEEVIAYLDEVQSMSDRILVEMITTTNQGRPMPMAILGSPPSSEPGTLWLSGKPTVFFTGSVHGNERAGKEGSLQLIRELALGELRPLLEDVNVLIVPSLNPDGAENRRRTNSLDYDMNRDFIVAESPEVQATLDILLGWWPDIYVDVHNGGAYPYNITYQATLHPAADGQLVDFARGPMYDRIKEHLATQDMITYWYSGPRPQDDGSWIWRTTWPWPRKQHTYGGLQNVITLLFEVPGTWSLEEQAANARETMEGMLRFAAENADAVRATVAGARMRTIQSPPAEIPISIEEASYGTDEFWVRPGGGADPELVTGENQTLFVPVETRPWPWAYAFDGKYDRVAEHLKRHGVEVEQLTEPATVSAERYALTAREYADEPYQNHLMATVDVAVQPPEQIELPAGTYVVRTAQNAGRLITQMMEPDAEDSLVAWNFFDATLPDAGEPDDPEYLDILRIPAPATGLTGRVVR